MPTPSQNSDISSLASRIDVLIETVNKRFDDVRIEMHSAMDRYVLNAVHELEVKRLDKRDDEQQQALDQLESRVIQAPQRYLINAGAIIGGLAGLITVLHALHLF